MKQKLKVLGDAIALLRREVHPGIPAQQIELLLLVATEPGVNMPELGRRLGMPQGTVSRNVKALSAYYEWLEGKRCERGHGLLRTEIDPANAPALAVFLTEAGEKLMQKLRAVL